MFQRTIHTRTHRKELEVKSGLALQRDIPYRATIPTEESGGAATIQRSRNRRPLTGVLHARRRDNGETS